MIQLQRHGKPFPQQELSSQQTGHGRAEPALWQEETFFIGQCKISAALSPMSNGHVHSLLIPRAPVQSRQ